MASLKVKRVIIGSGPAGLMNAYKGVLENKSVLLVEAGRNRSAQHCNIKSLKEKCINCNPCGNISGFGGCVAPDNAAKLSFPPSGKKLIELLGYKLVDELAQSFWTFYSKFAQINLPFPKVNYNNEQISTMINKMGSEFCNYPIHISNEAEHNLFLKNIFRFLKDRSKVLLNNNVDLNKDINLTDKTIDINGNKVAFDQLIIATGRKGYRNTNIFAENLGIDRDPENINLGFRVMLPLKYLKTLSEIHPDFKIKQKRADEALETFCFSNNQNGGRLKFLRYDDFLNIDGHISVSSNGDKIDNKSYGNFAILFENRKNPIRYNDFIERLRDNKMNFEYNVNNWHKFNQNGIFKEDESRALSEFLDKFLEIIAKENNVDKGQLYNEMKIIAPEVENIWARNKKLWVKDDIAMVGDCSGLAQGIVTSGMMGEACSKIRK